MIRRDIDSGPPLPQISTTVWNIDSAHTIAEFKVKHMMIANVKGQFSKVSGVLTPDESKLANSSADVTIEAASLETRDGQRDAHLKSADFFHVEKFPTLHFNSTGISVVRDGELAVEGDLTIRGVTRKVRFAVEGPTPPTKDLRLVGQAGEGPNGCRDYSRAWRLVQLGNGPGVP